MGPRIRPGARIMRATTALATLALVAILGTSLEANRAEGATTIAVTTTTDELNAGSTNGACSLREAIRRANGDTTDSACAADNGNVYTINVVSGSTYVLNLTGAGEGDAATGDLDIKAGRTILIQPAGGGDAYIDGNASDRVFDVASGAGLTLSRLFVINGSTSDNGGGITTAGTLTLTESYIDENVSGVNGGGIFVNNGTLVMTFSTASNNRASVNGGGIYNLNGTVQITGGQLDSNSSNANLGGGAGIFNSGALTLTDAIVSNNNANSGSGGGVYIDTADTLTAVEAVVFGNRADHGAGIHGENAGTITLTQSTISDNIASGAGGGISASGLPFTLESSTVSGNSAVLQGGGIYRGTANLAITNSTVSGNSTGGTGGGIYVASSAGTGVTLTNSTITRNTASTSAGGIFSGPNTVTLRNTIVAHQLAGANCVAGTGGFTSLGHNLASDNSCNLTQAGDIPAGNANLGTLKNNGGPTQTHALLADSDALGAGDDSICANAPVNGVDQRGVTRPQGAQCDIGAFEAGSGATDSDDDGVANATDNCPVHFNPSQLNTDSAPIVTPGAPNDTTIPAGDTTGDDCDADDDNDGRGDFAEGLSCNGSAATDALKADTDGDRVRDGAECTLGSNPTDVTSKPAPAAFADSDSDGISDAVEVRGYSSAPNNTDTDGDGCPDDIEAASINGDTIVSALDLVVISQRFFLTDKPVQDVNKDGTINALDLSLVAQNFMLTPC